MISENPTVGTKQQIMNFVFSDASDRFTKK